MHCRILLLPIILFLGLTATAANRTNVKTGNWNDATVWGGTIPVAGDNVTIATSTTVTINTNTAAIASLTVNGTLSFDATGTGRTLTITGTCTVNSGGKLSCKLPGSATTHSFLFSGTSIVNNGTFNLANGTNICNTTISGASSQTISGSSGYIFNKLTLNNSGGRMILVANGSHYSSTYQKATTLASNITTKDSLVIAQGLLLCCSGNSLSLTHTIANYKMGSSLSQISSAVSSGGIDTIRFNTSMLLNDATNSKVTFHVTGTFNSPNMTQANSGLNMTMIGPNCHGGTNNASKILLDGNVNLPDLLCFIGNAKKFGGTEPVQPQITFSGSLNWQYLKSYTITIPGGSKNFSLLSCYFGKLDSPGVFPGISLNGGTIVSPNTFTSSFKIFNANIQTSVVNSKTYTRQFSNSLAEWYVNGSWKIPNGASLAVHSDDTLLLKGNLDVSDGGEIAGSETEINSSGYVATQGPILFLEKTGQLLAENPALGSGSKPDSNQNVTLKNRTASLNWNLTGIAKNGAVNYSAANAQTIAARGYKKLFLSGGSFTKTLAGNVTVNDSLAIGSGITLANAGFTITAKKNIVNNGRMTGTGEFDLAGTVQQFLSGGTGDWENIEFNNAAGFTLNSAVKASLGIKFTNGIVHTDSVNLLSLTTIGKTFGGGGSNAFVDGPLFARATTLNFPIGNNHIYRPLGVENTIVRYLPMTAEYFFQTPVNAPLNGMDSISKVEYWNLSSDTALFPGGNVTLSWGPESRFNDTAHLLIAHHILGIPGDWTGTLVTSKTGNKTSGTATSGISFAQEQSLTFGWSSEVFLKHTLYEIADISGFLLKSDPVISNMQLKWNSDQSGNVNLTVYNVMGQKMLFAVQHEESSFNQMQLNVSKLSSGIYLLEMNDGKMKKDLKFVKQ